MTKLHWLGSGIISMIILSGTSMWLGFRALLAGLVQLRLTQAEIVKEVLIPVAARGRRRQFGGLAAVRLLVLGARGLPAPVTFSADPLGGTLRLVLTLRRVPHVFYLLITGS